MTDEQASSWWSADLEIAEKTVKTVVGMLDLSQNEFDALTDLAFNVGIGILLNESPNMNTAIAAGDYSAMSKELIYTKDALGNHPQGLIKRSADRTKLFLGTYGGKK